MKDRHEGCGADCSDREVDRAAQEYQDRLRVGVVLTFQEGWDEQDVRIALKNVMGVEAKTIRSFNPELGSPVFYIP